jgi:brefeldin A-resistance guanine nucleotide exchange factor 1
MLLVMSTAGIFLDDDAEPNTTTADRNYTALWQVTWERIDCFLPNLKRDLFLNRARASSPPPAAVEGDKPVENSEETVTITVVEEQETEGNVLAQKISQLVPSY